MLPSPSPKFTATAMWGPILAWCALELLAESINSVETERVALDLFDRLRLREPFAQVFAALGFEGEEAWRAAARIKVVLLTGAGVGNPAPIESASAPRAMETEIAPGTAPAIPEPSEPEVSPIEEALEAADESLGMEGKGFSPYISTTEPAEIFVLKELPVITDEKAPIAAALWHDPDVRWLTGVHEAEGHFYLVREQYEELLWWLLMPSLLRLAGEPTPSRAAVEELSKTVEEALANAEAAKYRIDELLGSVVASEFEGPESTEPEVESPTVEEGTESPVETVPIAGKKSVVPPKK